MIDYSDRTVYEYLNNPFLADCGIPDLNITHMQKYDSPPPPKDPTIPLIILHPPFFCLWKLC